MSRAKTVVSWALQILCGALFVLIGTVKFADPTWARNFERWGYPSGSHLIVGAIEAAAGLGLLIPRLTPYAAGVLMIVMTGAAATHVLHGEMQRFTAPLVYFVILGVIAWLRRPRRVSSPQPPLAVSPPLT
jgi:putative oxidoreductase